MDSQISQLPDALANITLKAPANEFRPFQRLPDELKLKVWRYAAKQPHFLKFKPLSYVEVGEDGELYTYMNYVQVSRPRPLLATCFDARNVVKDLCPMEAPDNSTYPRIYFNPAMDVIFVTIGSNGSNGMMFNCHMYREPVIDIKSVRYLAVGGYEFGDDFMYQSYFREFADKVKDYPNLEALFLVDPLNEFEADSWDDYYDERQAEAEGQPYSEISLLKRRRQVKRAMKQLKMALKGAMTMSHGARGSEREVPRSIWWDDPVVEFVTEDELKERYS